jgi:hypothetical protein
MEGEKEKPKDLTVLARHMVRKVQGKTESQAEALSVLQAVVTLVLGPEWRIVSTKENQN